MAITITKVDDKAEGFTVEFTVISQYRTTFPARPPGAEQMQYARAQVQAIVPQPVEKPEGVAIVPPVLKVEAIEPVIEVQPEPALAAPKKNKT